MSEEKILTLHPQGKQGVNISKDKYDTVKNAIIEVLTEKDELSFYPLVRAVTEKLKGKFEGSIGWYATTVKLDMEARQILDCSRGKGPQVIRLAKAE
jgi:hypothetical protein